MSLLQAASQLLVAELARVIDGQLMRPLFQPVVALDTGRVVGFEALTRGPAGSALERPDVLFAAARNAGRVAELDAACRSAALAAARCAGLRQPLTLFVNAAVEGLEPAASMQPFPVVVEISERDLITNPTALRRLGAQVRAAGWGLALDDVSPNPAALALLPLVHADVIKVDVALLAHQSRAAVAAAACAVRAEAERGAVIVGERLETAADVQAAREFGATLGQGWLFGPPAAVFVGLSTA